VDTIRGRPLTYVTETQRNIEYKWVTSAETRRIGRIDSACPRRPNRAWQADGKSIL